MTENEFYQKSEKIINWFFEQQPVMGTQMGVHEGDDRLPDCSLENITENTKQIEIFLERIESIETDNFSKEANIDYTLFKKFLNKNLREFKIEKDHLRNPNDYLGTVFGGVMFLLMKEFAPLADRLESLLGRLKDIPEVLEDAKANLKPSQVPPVWVKVALQQTEMAAELFKGVIPQLAEANPELEAEICSQSSKAKEAVNEFENYLKETVLPQAEGDFAVGEDYFNRKLWEDHLVSYDAEELLATGWEIFENTKEEMEALVKEINPNKSVQEILEEAKAEHPSAENLLEVYRQRMAESRQFVLENDIASIPEGEDLTVIETPSYLQPLIPYAAYMPPGIFEEDLEGLFLVTPVDPEASADKKEEKLKGHFNTKLPITTLHEGYPGHHLQLVWNVDNNSTVRKLGSVLSTLFVEGWAFYCEELMEDLGYIDAPIQRLARLSDQLWRAARIILDVKLHCKELTVEEAVDFLVEECHLEQSNALTEVRRYTSTPTQPQSCLMGKLEIIDIIEEYKVDNPDKSLQEIHDSILSCGSLPPKLMRQQLFE